MIKINIEHKKFFHHARRLGITKVIMCDKKYSRLCEDIAGDSLLEDIQIFGISIIPESKIDNRKRQSIGGNLDDKPIF